MYSIEELKANIKYYTFGFIGLSLAFTYWQRVYIPRGFFAVSIMLGGAAGVFYGTIKTSSYFVERLD